MFTEGIKIKIKMSDGIEYTGYANYTSLIEMVKSNQAFYLLSRVTYIDTVLPPEPTQKELLYLGAKQIITIEEMFDDEAR